MVTWPWTKNLGTICIILRTHSPVSRAFCPCCRRPTSCSYHVTGVRHFAARPFIWLACMTVCNSLSDSRRDLTRSVDCFRRNLKTRLFSVYYRTRSSRGWVALYKSTRPIDNRHWHYKHSQGPVKSNLVRLLFQQHLAALSDPPNSQPFAID